VASRPSETSVVTVARVTGVLYLIIIVLGLFSEVYVRSELIVRGDAAATASHIAASELLFRFGFASDVIVFLCDVAVAVLLYVLLRPVSKSLSLMATGFRLTGTAIYGFNLLNYFVAVLLLSGADYLAVFEPGQLHALALLFLEMHRHGYDLGLVFFGLHCLVLGYLLFKSDYFPKILGVLMVLASLGYLVGSFTLFLFPEYEDAITPVYVAPLIGELSLCLWLLIKGVRIQQSDRAESDPGR
jgi:hypothetical protein